jgi:hypothetical protein
MDGVTREGVRHRKRVPVRGERRFPVGHQLASSTTPGERGVSPVYPGLFVFALFPGFYSLSLSVP